MSDTIKLQTLKFPGLKGTYTIPSKMSDLEQDIEFSSIGKTTPEGGEIFNDYDLNIATGKYSHAEGHDNIATGYGSHAEGGWGSCAKGSFSHAEGASTSAWGEYSHAEGLTSFAIGEGSHTEGNNTNSLGNYSHSEGEYNYCGLKGYYWYWANEDDRKNNIFTISASRENDEMPDLTEWSINSLVYFTYGNSGSLTRHDSQAFIENIDGNKITVKNDVFTKEEKEAIAIGRNNGFCIWNHHNPQAGVTLVRLNSQGAEEYLFEAEAAHAEGVETAALNPGAHAEGRRTIARGWYSHAEGTYSNANGHYSHAEGYNSFATGTQGAHAEGENTYSEGKATHSEGFKTKAQGNASHAEGWKTIAKGQASHTEGQYTEANFPCAHAEGTGSIVGTTSGGNSAHAEGYYTIAGSDHQHVQGRYNIEDRGGKYAHIVGNGEPPIIVDGEEYIPETRSNAHTLDWSGNAWYAGEIEGATLKSNGRAVINSLRKTSVTDSLLWINDTKIGYYPNSGAAFRIYGSGKDSSDLPSLYLGEASINSADLALLNTTIKNPVINLYNKFITIPGIESYYLNQNFEENNEGVRLVYGSANGNIAEIRGDETNKYIYLSRPSSTTDGKYAIAKPDIKTEIEHLIVSFDIASTAISTAMFKLVTNGMQGSLIRITDSNEIELYPSSSASVRMSTGKYLNLNGEFVNITFIYDKTAGKYSIWIDGENFIFNQPYWYTGFATAIQIEETGKDGNLIIDNFVIGSYKTEELGEYNYNMTQNSNIPNNFKINTHHSVALGSGHNVNANYAFAGNSYNTINGKNATAFGYNNIANRDSQFVIGQYNKPDSNALFIIGDGDSTAPSNAFVVDKDGNANIKGDVIIENNISMKDLWVRLLEAENKIIQLTAVIENLTT